MPLSDRALGLLTSDLPSARRAAFEHGLSEVFEARIAEDPSDPWQKLAALMAEQAAEQRG